MLTALLVLTLNAADPYALGEVIGQPLDLQVLSETVDDGVRVREVTFTSEATPAGPVRVYGWLAQPDGAAAKSLPGMVQLHGGGGTANRASAVGQARTGHGMVLNIDWSGDRSRGDKVTDFTPLGALAEQDKVRWVADDLSDFGAKHVVRAIVRSVDLLLAQPATDPGRISVMGGSWGGFLSLLASSLDPRVTCVASGFGAGGFRDTWSLCSRPVMQLPEAAREFWLAHVDPLPKVKDIRGPVILMTATNELHFWLGGAMDTVRAFPPGSRLILCPNTVHRTSAGVVWPNAAWFATHCGDGPAWPDLTEFQLAAGKATATIASPEAIERAELIFSPGKENWPGRCWLSFPAEVVDGQVSGELPAWLADAEGDGYFLLTDALRRSVSTVPLHVTGRGLAEVSAVRPDPGLIDDFVDGPMRWRHCLTVPKAIDRLMWRPELGLQVPMLRVTNATPADAMYAVETNAISLAASKLTADGALSLKLRTAQQPLKLTVELTSAPGQQDEQRHGVTREVPEQDGWQTITIPLSEFGDGLAGVSELRLKAPIGQDANVDLGMVRVD